MLLKVKKENQEVSAEPGMYVCMSGSKQLCFQIFQNPPQEFSKGHILYAKIS